MAHNNDVAEELPAAVDPHGRHDLAVLECLRAAPSHPTAAELYEAVRRQCPRIGRATVYRALARLESAGLVTSVGRDALGQHYDARTDRHDHAICLGCGRVLDLLSDADPLPLQAFEELAATAQRSGLVASSYEIRLYGRCAACASSATAQ